jgi:Zn-dependent metalloprotease
MLRGVLRFLVPCGIAVLALGAPAAHAIQPIAPPEGAVDAGANLYALPDIEVQPSVVRWEKGLARQAALAQPVLNDFFARNSDAWEVRWDQRGNRPNLIQGAGVPLLPGIGNGLTANKLGLQAGKEIGMAEVEAQVRSFLAANQELFRVSGADLRLRPEGSVNLGKDQQVWFVELQQHYRGIPVEGAVAFFRINNGNLVQFGTEKIGDVKVSTLPRIDRAVAIQKALQALGFKLSQVSEIVQPGTLKIIPLLTALEQPAERYLGKPGEGYRHALVWEVAFRKAGEPSTYQAWVDAANGNLVQLTDLSSFVTATATGGIYPTTNTDPEVVRPLPFLNVTNGAAKVTNANGEYDYTGAAATSTVSGKYIKITDNCGAISLADSTTGNLAFGTSGGTDCTTPGVGGVGNTHSMRSGYYHLTNINRKAASFLPANAWLNGTLTAKMNVNSTCNAFWDGSTVNFYRSGGGCSNTGEIAAVFLHEWGHGMDTNSGGAASDKGTGEAVGDTFAFLETRNPCIGPNFQPGVNCANCTSCTGVRDVAEFGLGGAHTIAKPSNVASNTGINCGRYACPYRQLFIIPYQGPMGYEGHCESYIASSANWDLAQSLVSYWGVSTGWAKMDAIWYKSLTPSKAAYQVASGGKCNPAATVNGCGSSNWYTVFLAADDDDGNLANGTPNACRIWDAYNAHGIACGARPTCTSCPKGRSRIRHPWPKRNRRARRLLRPPERVLHPATCAGRSGSPSSPGSTACSSWPPTATRAGRSASSTPATPRISSATPARCSAASCSTTAFPSIRRVSPGSWLSSTPWWERAGTPRRSPTSRCARSSLSSRAGR